MNEEELAARPAPIADLRAKIERDGEETRRLKKEGLKLKIIDENGRPREEHKFHTDTGDRMEEVGLCSLAA